MRRRLADSHCILRFLSLRLSRLPPPRLTTHSQSLSRSRLPGEAAAAAAACNSLAREARGAVSPPLPPLLAEGDPIKRRLMLG